MKREDQITQAAMDYCREYKTSKLTAENMALLAFSDGAQWADENPKTSTLAEACRKKENQLRTQMEYEDHRNDNTLYAKFKDILRAIQVMSGYSKSVGWSQYIEDSKSRFNVSLNIDDEGNINIELEFRKVKND